MNIICIHSHLVEDNNAWFEDQNKTLAFFTEKAPSDFIKEFEDFTGYKTFSKSYKYRANTFQRIFENIDKVIECCYNGNITFEELENFAICIDAHSYDINLYENLKEAKLKEIFGEEDYYLYNEFSEKNFTKLCSKIEDYSDYKKFIILATLIDNYDEVTDSREEFLLSLKKIIPDLNILKKCMQFLNDNDDNKMLFYDGYDNVSYFMPYTEIKIN